MEWVREYVETHPLRWAGAQRLIAGGVPGAVIAQMNGAGTIGAGRVALSRDGGRFEPDGPDARLLIAVRDGGGAVIDVVAVSTSCENEWALLTGMADMLGERALEHAVAHGARELHLSATPLDWLRSGCAGICVLAWNRQAVTALRMLPERLILVVGPGMRERLRGLLAFGGLPQIAESRAHGLMLSAA